MVTSSAVVGSSAISNLGEQHSASAIIARWRMPPESSKGYAAMRRSGSGMPTRRSMAAVRARAACLEMSLCSSTVSLICSPMLWIGPSEVIGSWKIIAISRPRTARIARPAGGNAARSVILPSPPRHSNWPPTMRPGRSTMFRIDRAVTDLPQPDSPSTHSVCPTCTAKSTPSTDRTTPSLVKKCVRRSCTRNSGSSGIRIGRVAQPVAEEIQ